TQAMTVPITMFTSVTSTDSATVSLTAARVCELVIVSRKPDSPSDRAVVTTSASGISTSRLNHSTATPSPSADVPVNAPGRATRRRVAPPGTEAGMTVKVLLLARFLLDLRDDAVVLVEELRVGAGPATEVVV